MATMGSQNDQGGLINVLIFLIEASFYKKSRQQRKKRGKQIKNTSLAALPTSLQTPNYPQRAPEWLRRSGKGSTRRFLGVLIKFCKISFLIWALLLWEKETTKEKKGGETLVPKWWLKQWLLCCCQCSARKSFVNKSLGQHRAGCWYKFHVYVMAFFEFIQC